MRGRFLGSLLVVGLLLAACGGDDDDTSSSSQPAQATPGSQGGAGQEDDQGQADPDGVARFGYDLISASTGGFTWDPRGGAASTGHLGVYHWVYGGLMRPAPDGSLVPDLAEGFTIVDPNTIEVVMRPDVVFPDGSPMDAAAVKAGLERNLAETGIPPYAAEFYKLSEIEVVDDTTLRLTIPDGTAASWAEIFLGSMETVIVPPDTDFQKPAGPGPYRVVEFAPENRVVLEKNPDYWNADAMQIPRIELINTPYGTQAPVQALNAGQIDWVQLSIFGNIDAVSDEFEVDTDVGPNFESHFPICKTEEPFSDPQVRQALSMAIDREAINEALYDGMAEPAWDLFPEGHELHNPDLTGRYAYDPEAARELLAEAGYSDGFTFDLIPIASGTMSDVAQIYQQQLADIGVTMNIVQSADFVQDFYQRKVAPMALVPTLAQTGRAKLNQWVGDTVANACGWDDPELNELTQELLTVSAESDEGVEVWHEIQAKIVDDALSIFVLHAPRVTAYDPERVGDPVLAHYQIPAPDVYNMFVKQS